MKTSQTRRKAKPGLARVLQAALIAAVACSTAVTLLASPPSWWSNGVLDPQATADDYAAVNQGQLKNIAKQASLELDTRLPGGAGTNVLSLVQGWSTPGTNTDDFAPVNLGQLKNVAKPFYDRLQHFGISTNYPWTGITNAANDFALANIGQVKNLFGFELGAPEGELPGWWVSYFFPSLTGIEPYGDEDEDGIQNIYEFLGQSDPRNRYSWPGETVDRLGITEPLSGSVILENSPIRILAEAHDLDGLARVEFYLGPDEIGEVQADPFNVVFELVWNSSSAGVHELTVRAVDRLDNITVSPPVVVTVEADSDTDLMPDAYEEARFGSLDEEASGDFDGDGFPNIFEHRHGTSPSDSDDHPQFSSEQAGPYRYFIVDATLSENTDREKTSISAAIADATDFDVIEVRPGTYPDSLALNYRVYLFSTHGARSTVLSGTGPQTNISVIDLNTESVVAGFTIGRADQKSTGSSNARRGITVNVHSSQNKPRVVGCLISYNTMSYRGGGVLVNAGSPAFISCTIAGNYAPEASGIYNDVSHNQVRLINTLLWNPNGDGKDLAGQMTGYTQHGVLSRDPFSGAARIDGVALPTNNPGLTADWSLTYDSPARQAGQGEEFSRVDADGEVRAFLHPPDIGVDEFVDSDGDRLPDRWEDQHFASLTRDWDDDSEIPEGDGLVNLLEYHFGFDPTQSETSGNQDGDLSAAVFSDKRMPWYPAAWKVDSDGDGLTDGEEIFYETDPESLDSNGDGLFDGIAVELGFDPASNDCDNDTLTNAEEIALGTSPFHEDTDGDDTIHVDRRDHLDAFPLDPTRWNPPSAAPGDIAPPVIALTTPEGAVEL